jgi:hypothetical protein
MTEDDGKQKKMGFREKAQAFVIAVAMIVSSKLPSGDHLRVRPLKSKVVVMVPGVCACPSCHHAFDIL